MKIVLIGSGNVATQFGIAFRNAGHEIVQVYSNTQKNAKTLASKLDCGFTSDKKKITAQSDLFFVALTDEATHVFLKTFNPGNTTVIHTSGSVPFSAFNKKLCKNFGVFYPMKSFTKNQKTNLKDAVFFLESNNKKTEKFLDILAHSFSDNVYKVNSRQRFAIHVAAVFINNFPNHMIVLGGKILKKEKLSFEIFYPLIEQSFKKILTESPATLQTGPARRGDMKTLDAHLKYLSKFPQHKKIYKLLSESIMKEK